MLARSGRIDFGVLASLVLTGLFFPATAFAYVDPGSGSVIVTTTLGLIAAIGYTFRKYFYKIRRLITGKSPDDELDADEQEQKDSE